MEPSVVIAQEGNAIIITLNRPKALNAINAQVMEGLNDFFTEGYRSYSGYSGVIITGSGDKAFAAGADIKEFSSLNIDQGINKSKYGHDTFFAIERFHVPVIALVNGFALGGGCELAMACHIRIATPNAKFGQPEVNLGLIPGYGGSQRLIQLIGKGRATEMLITADMIDANTALDFGLVTHLLEKEEAMIKAFKIIDKIKTKGPIAIANTIKLINAYFATGKDAFEQEYMLFGSSLVTEECMEGAQAFVEKRKANFKWK